MNISMFDGKKKNTKRSEAKKTKQQKTLQSSKRKKMFGQCHGSSVSQSILFYIAATNYATKKKNQTLKSNFVSKVCISRYQFSTR